MYGNLHGIAGRALEEIDGFALSLRRAHVL